MIRGRPRRPGLPWPLAARLRTQSLNAAFEGLACLTPLGRTIVAAYPFADLVAEADWAVDRRLPDGPEGRQ